MTKKNQSFHCSHKRGKMPFLMKNGYSIYNCEECKHRFVEIQDTKSHVKAVYSDEYFFEGKQGYPNYLAEKDRLIKYGLDYAKIVSKYMEPGKLLSVGCAAGFTLKGFKQSGWESYGLEPNESMANYGRKVLNLNITTCDLESFQTDLKFDLIDMIQVIGHLHNLQSSLWNIKNLLKKDGFVLVESWDMKSIFAKIMGKHWHEYSPPSVINWFSDETITKLFANFNLKLVAQGRPPKRISVNHGLSLFKETTPEFIFKKPIIQFFKRTIGKTTVPYPPMDLKWYLFQK